jgi:hypothetical protein
MNFELARNHVMPWGKYKGCTLDFVAKTDEGLLYMDWFVGAAEKESATLTAMNEYLADPAVARELDAAVAARG